MLHTTVMRARPATMFGKRHTAVATNGLFAIGLAPAGRRMNPMTRRVHVMLVVAGERGPAPGCAEAPSACTATTSARGKAVATCIDHPPGEGLTASSGIWEPQLDS